MKGFVHSIETFGTVDGPGIRFVLFLKGCPLRCLYCHNPDTWYVGGAKEYEVKEIIDLYLKNINFYKNGGITVSGGEPLMQIDFIIELFMKAKEYNIHTCIDTSGISFVKEKLETFNLLLRYTDLFLVDIKELENNDHIKLTGESNENILNFIDFLDNNKKEFWIRHVVLYNYTFNKNKLVLLGNYLKKYKYLKKIQLLPYHDMGKIKYKNLKMDYILKDIKPTSKEDIKLAYEYLRIGLLN